MALSRSTSISQSPFHFLPPSASEEPFGHRTRCSWLIILPMCYCTNHTKACRHTRPYRSFAFRYWSTCHIRTDLPCLCIKHRKWHVVASACSGVISGTAGSLKRNWNSLDNRNSCLTPAKNQEHRYQQWWTDCKRYDQPVDDICLSIAWSA